MQNCHMVALLLDYKFGKSSSIETYYRNRLLLAGRTCKSLGRWSLAWATAVLSWHDHCQRHNDVNMWHFYILNCRDVAWLAEQRRIHGKGIISRTRSRLKAGKVSCRWSESINAALEVAPHWVSVMKEYGLSVRTLISASLSRA